MNEDDHCLYRGPEGRQCAAGPFVKDRCPEGSPFDSLPKRYRIDTFPDDSLAVKLVTELQEIHDCYKPIQWASELATLDARWFPQEQSNGQN